MGLAVYLDRLFYSGSGRSLLSTPGPRNPGESRRDVLCPAAARVFDDERQCEEQEKHHHEAVPAVLRCLRIAPPAGTTSFRGREGQLQEAQPRDLAAGASLNVLEAGDGQCVVTRSAIVAKLAALIEEVVVSHRDVPGPVDARRDRSEVEREIDVPLETHMLNPQAAEEDR